MIFYEVKTPEEYQKIFYRQIGLKKNALGENGVIWENKKVGTVHSIGSANTLVVHAGSYTIPTDFFIKYRYEKSYLHWGMIYEGSFLTIDRASDRINSWRKGQYFKGVEVWVNMDYIKEQLLPVLGYEKEALSFLKENVRYALAEEVQNILFRMERLLLAHTLTRSLLFSLVLESLAFLLHQKAQIFPLSERAGERSVLVGKRKLRLSDADMKKIIMVHDLIKKDASSFYTIYELSKEAGISEQKLKAGFFELYQQTLWDCANQMRMTLAIELLEKKELGIAQIAERTGYHSQSAFIRMFKKWSGVTPGQFRRQLTRIQNACYEE